MDWGGFVLLGIIVWLLIGLLARGPRTGGGSVEAPGDETDTDDDRPQSKPHRAAVTSRIATSGCTNKKQMSD